MQPVIARASVTPREAGARPADAPERVRRGGVARQSCESPERGSSKRRGTMPRSAVGQPRDGEGRAEPRSPARCTPTRQLPFRRSRLRVVSRGLGRRRRLRGWARRASHDDAARSAPRSSSGSPTGGRRSSASRSRQERRSDIATFSLSPVANGHWSKRPSFPRSSSRLLGPACGRARRAPSSRLPQRCSRSRGGHWWPAVAPDGHGYAPASSPRSTERSASCYCFSRSWFTETRRPGAGDFSQPGRERLRDQRAVTLLMQATLRPSRPASARPPTPPRRRARGGPSARPSEGGR